jgi:hypothetical protein
VVLSARILHVFIHLFPPPTRGFVCLYAYKRMMQVRASTTNEGACTFTSALMQVRASTTNEGACTFTSALMQLCDAPDQVVAFPV